MWLYSSVNLKCPYSREDYDRYYRSGTEDYYRRKDEPFRDPYRDPWNGRREPEGMHSVFNHLQLQVVFC